MARKSKKQKVTAHPRARTVKEVEAWLRKETMRFLRDTEPMRRRSWESYCRWTEQEGLK